MNEKQEDYANSEVIISCEYCGDKLLQCHSCSHMFRVGDDVFCKVTEGHACSNCYKLLYIKK